MSHISRLPLPSIVLVLITDHIQIPRRPSVIKFAATPAPATKVDHPQDLMEMSDVAGVNAPPNDEDYVNESHGRLATSPIDDDEPMDLAESIHDAPVADEQERFVVGFIKEKILNVLFSIRRLLRVDPEPASLVSLDNRRVYGSQESLTHT